MGSQFIFKLVCKQAMVYNLEQFVLMGICGSKDSQAANSRTPSFDVVPTDTQTLKNVTLPILSFFVLLSDIKIKKCGYDFVSLKFKIQNVHEHQLPLKQMDRIQRAYWKINHTFQFMMTQYEIRKKFLVIEAQDKSKKVLATLKINLYTIWIGPYHLDFKFELPNAKLCRLSFNFKISQGIHFTIENIKTQMKPIQKKFMQDQFTFSIEAIIGQQLQPSNYAYTVCIKPTLTEPKPKEKHQMETNYVLANKIIWSQDVSKEIPLPKFDKKIAFYEIYASSLHLTFWKVLPGLYDVEEPRYQIEAECFISLAKLLSAQYSVSKDPVTSISYNRRVIILQEKTWLHGKQVGKVNVQFKFSLQVHQKQMQACVRTEQGILTSSPVFYNKGDQVKQCEEIQNLKKLSHQIQKQFINLGQNSQQENNFIILKENMLRINNLMSRELALLERTSKESILFYQYKNQIQLIKAQRFLIDLAFKMITYIREERTDISEISWTILTTILKRGEFKLSHLGFSKADKDNIDRNSIGEELGMKIEVGVKYQELLNHLLKETLKSLQFKGDEAERIFAQAFCSYAYFRIPLFRQHILSVVKKENDPEIPEWRGTQFNLYQQGSESTDFGKIDDFYDNLFDWQNNFYKCLAIQQKYKANRLQLQSILLQDKWKNRLAKRSGAFYTFFQNLITQIQYVSVISKHIKWQYLPGYNRLLHAFLVQMKNLKIKNYTDRFKNCCIKMLANQRLLNIFVVILLKKTNINESETIFITFEIIDEFFKSIKKNLRPIPGTFDYKFFLEGIKQVLESELQYSISQVLLFIYNNFNTFNQQFALQLAMYLISKPFFKFFFHWSFNLRHIFHVLLYSRISRFQQSRNSESPGKSSTQSNYLMGIKMSISQRYEAILDIIKTQIQPNAVQSNIDRFYEKDLFKKMRSKIKGKKVQPDSTTSIKAEVVRSDSRHLDYIPPAQLRSTHSLQTSNRAIVPKKLLYFSDQEMTLIPMRDTEMCYVKQALSEYAAIADDFKKNLAVDPSYHPEMKVKKVLDEKQLKPITVDEW